MPSWVLVGVALIYARSGSVFLVVYIKSSGQVCLIRCLQPTFSLQWPWMSFLKLNTFDLQRFAVHNYGFCLAVACLPKGLMIGEQAVDVAGCTQMVLFAVAVEGGRPHKGAHRPDTGEADR